MEKGEIRINTENIFPIIKKAVYSDHEIFLRELVSNGVDAISLWMGSKLPGYMPVLLMFGIYNDYLKTSSNLLTI